MIYRVGKLLHAVTIKKAKRPNCPFNDWGKKFIPDDDYSTWISMCGAKPGRTSIGWQWSTSEVTCRRCLAKIQPR